MSFMKYDSQLQTDVCDLSDTIMSMITSHKDIKALAFIVCSWIMKDQGRAIMLFLTTTLIARVVKK